MAQMLVARQTIEPPKTFNPTTKTSTKLLSFGWANKISSTTATLHFKAYDKIETTALYYNHGRNKAAFNEEKWMLYSKSIPFSGSTTTPNFYSIEISNLIPLTYYSFVVVCTYRSHQVSHFFLEFDLC